MGTWGTGISSNDIFEDLNIEFFDLYNDGMDVPEITKIIIERNQDLINSDEDSNNFWIALAMFQWECKALYPEIHKRVSDIIENGNDISLWKELQANSADLKKRQKVLDNFLKKISTEKKSAKRRKKKKYRDAIFEKGDCLTFKLEDGNWGGAFVLYAEKNTEFGSNYIAATNINSKNKPNLQDFRKAEILVQCYEAFIDNRNDPLGKLIEEIRERPTIVRYEAIYFKEDNFEIEVIGNLTIKRPYDPKTCKTGSQWPLLSATFKYYNARMEMFGKAKKKLKLKYYLKKYWL